MTILDRQKELAVQEIAKLQSLECDHETTKEIIGRLTSALINLTGGERIRPTEANLFGEMLKQCRILDNFSKWQLKDEKIVRSALNNKDFTLAIFRSTNNPDLQLFYYEVQGITFAYLLINGQIQESAEKNVVSQFKFYKQQLKKIGFISFPDLAVSHFRYHD